MLWEKAAVSLLGRVWELQMVMTRRLSHTHTTTEKNTIFELRSQSLSWDRSQEHVQDHVLSKGLYTSYIQVRTVVSQPFSGPFLCQRAPIPFSWNRRRWLIYSEASAMTRNNFICNVLGNANELFITEAVNKKIHSGASILPPPPPRAARSSTTWSRSSWTETTARPAWPTPRTLTSRTQVVNNMSLHVVLVTFMNSYC